MNKDIFNKIIFEYSLTNKSTDSALVLLPGLPYSPKEYPAYSLFNKNNFDVYFIHYEGTWGSDGEFLTSSPTESIDEFLDYLSKKYTNIFIIGTSFGGGLVLTLKDKEYIKAICSLSPVISYKNVKNINTLGKYLKENHFDKYNFKMENMDRLLNDELICPNNQFNIKSNKVKIFIGTQDDQISPEEIIEFSNKNKILYKKVETGHITLSNIKEDLFEDIFNFFTNIQ